MKRRTRSRRGVTAAADHDVEVCFATLLPKIDGVLAEIDRRGSARFDARQLRRLAAAARSLGEACAVLDAAKARAGKKSR